MKKHTKADYEELARDGFTVFDENNCPMTATLKVIGGKWKLILINLISLNAPARFGILKRKIKGITPGMLTSMLRELEQDGIIERKVYAEVPARVEYALTPHGVTLRPLLEMMCAWGYEHYVDRKSNAK